MSINNDEKTAAADGVIVIHPPLSGEVDAPSAAANEPVTTVILRDTITIVATPTPAPVSEPLSTTAPATGQRWERALGLDALRGLLLLAMTFAMTIPFGVFPDWMYHTQNPPPSGEFAAIAGITWRDLLFPGFLFTMSAAIPITNSLRIAKGMPYPAVVITALKRAALLMVFALIIGHVNPYWTEDYTKRGNLMAIAGFLACWPIFMRKLDEWSERTYRVIKNVGWIAVAALLFAGPLLYGSTFSMERRDGIISSLAFCSLAATCIWLATRMRPALRLCLIAAIAAAKLAATAPGWVQDAWSATPAAWLYQSWYLELMIIVLAGTLVGDLLLRWMKPRTAEDEAVAWPAARLIPIALVCAAFTPITVVGLFNRAGAVTAGLSFALSIAGAFLFLNPRSERDRVLFRLYGWATFWLALGLILEPFEGGIKKVPQTLSYLTLTTGLATSLLIVALITTDLLASPRRWLRPLVQIGQNPLIAYVAFMLFLNHIAYGLGVGSVFTQTWWQATIRGLAFTAAAAAIVWTATRRRIFWRA